MIDDCLLWRPPINSIVTKMAKFISIFYKTTNSVNRDSLIFLHNSLVYPHLTYCNTVWCTGARTPLDSIHKIQKKIVRIITFSNRREHSAPLLKFCTMLKILDNNRYRTSIFVYRTLFSPGHSRSDLFVVYNGAYNTRFADEGRLIVPRACAHGPF